MGAEQLGRLLERLLATPSWEETIAIVQGNPELLTPAVDKPLAYLIDAARRDGAEDRGGELDMLSDLLRMSRELGPQAAVAALSGTTEAELPHAAHEFWELYRSTRGAPFLDAAIERWEADLARTPRDSPERARALNNVATGFAARYELTRAPGDLERAVEASEAALLATPPNAEERATRLSNWAGAVLARYGESGDLADLDAALRGLSEAADAAAPASVERALCLNNYAAARYTRYERLREEGDLDALVDAAQEAVELTPPGSRDYAERQNALAVGLERKYIDRGDASALDAALAAWDEALANGGRDSPAPVDVVFAFGRALWRRHRLKGDMSDRVTGAELLSLAFLYGRDDARPLLDELFAAGFDSGDRRAGDEPVAPPELVALNDRVTFELREFAATGNRAALDAAVRGWHLVLAHPALDEMAGWRSSACMDAGQAFWTRFKVVGDDGDLAAAIKAFEQAVAGTPPGSPNLGGRRSNLGVALTDRFARSRERADITRAIEVLEASLEDDQPPGPRRAGMRGNLANALVLGAFDSLDPSPIESAIELLDLAIAECAEGSPERIDHALTRAGALLELHLRVPKRVDLGEVLAELDELAGATAPEQPGQVRALILVGRAALQQYEALGRPEDLERAVTTLERAVDAAMGSPLEPLLLEQLGLARLYQSASSGRLSDVERAVDALTAALAATPERGLEWYELLGALGAAILSRAQIRRDADERSRALDLLREAQEHLPPASPKRGLVRAALGAGLLARHAATGEGADIDAAIEELAEVAADAPDGSRNPVVLARALLARYRRDGSREDLDEAVEVLGASTARELNPRDRAVRLTQLGHALVDRYRVDPEPTDRQRAVVSFKTACELTLAVDPHVAFDAARAWADLEAAEVDWQAAAEPYRVGLEALARLLSAPALREEKELWLRDARGFAADAAFGLSFARDRRAAVVAVERNRALLLTEVLQRERFDVGRLRALGHGEVVDEYERAVERITVLEESEISGDAAVHTAPRPARSRLADDVRTARRALETAVRQIRSVPGYGELFGVPTFDEIVQLAGGVPLVYLVPGQGWGSAYVVNANAPPPVLLPELSAARVTERARQYLDAYAVREERPGEWRDQLERTSAWLWSAAMGPLLDVLAGQFGEIYLGRRTRGDRVPPLVLVPVGLLAILPLHAAWTSDEPTGVRRYALDQVCVTYTPNAFALGEARRGAERTRKRRLLAVEEPLPVSAGRLPGAGAEVAAAVAAVGRATTLRHEDATRDDVLAQLRGHTVAHLACHGRGLPDDPLDSFLLLADDARLTLRDIMGVRVSELRLVVLSACETAVVGHELPDEVVGLPTGLLQAGAAGVIASGWSVPDTSSALLLSRFYELWTGRPRKEPAEALRQAQQWVRDTSNGAKLAHMPLVMSPVAEQIPVRGRRLWERAHGHRHPYYWAGFTYVGA